MFLVSMVVVLLWIYCVDSVVVSGVDINMKDCSVVSILFCVCFFGVSIYVVCNLGSKYLVSVDM